MVSTAAGPVANHSRGNYRLLRSPDTPAAPAVKPRGPLACRRPRLAQPCLLCPACRDEAATYHAEPGIMVACPSRR